MNLSLNVTIKYKWWAQLYQVIYNHMEGFILFASTIIAWASWFYYFTRGYNLAYNDAMSHLDIARRVSDNITPGLAQLGSVWLPLLHVLMLPTVWIDVFWQTGMSASIISMVSYILTVLGVYKITYKLTRNIWSGFFACLVVALNTNSLYLQTTALTEPLFIVLFTWTMYYLVKWVELKQASQLVAIALLVCLATLTRYDGWALFGITGLAVFLISLVSHKEWYRAEGVAVLYGTLAIFGVVLWFGWNWTIFGDPLYFATGEFSAKAQQDQLEAADDLPTKGDWVVSSITYFYAMVGNIGIVTMLVGTLGWVVFVLDAKSLEKKIMAMVFLAPLLFNILALYLGHSVIHLPEIVGQSWFNVRYGLIVLPWLAVFIGYLANYSHPVVRMVTPMLVGLQIFLFFSSSYIITLDDGLWGSSQKNVKDVGQWINAEAQDSDSYWLVSVASHDAILFSSGLPMNRFIHEGTGDTWRQAIQDPASQAEYIIMRTHDQLDLVSRNVEQDPDFFNKYTLVYDDEFADIYKRNETN